MGKYKKRDYHATQVAKRKAAEKAQQEKTARRKAWWKENCRKVSFIGGVALGALLAVWLLLEYNVGMGNSIPTFFGRLVGVEDNWIVGNASDKDETARYYRMASYDAPEGYEKVEGYADTIDDNPYTVAAAYDAVDENALVRQISLASVQGRTANENMSMLTMLMTNATHTDVKQATVAGQPVEYLYVVFEDSQATAQAGTRQVFASLCMGYDTAYDASVTVMLSGQVTAEANVPSEEQLLAEAEKLLTGLEIAK